jgi:hypothetical protein
MNLVPVDVGRISVSVRVYCEVGVGRHEKAVRRVKLSRLAWGRTIGDSEQTLLARALCKKALKVTTATEITAQDKGQTDDVYACVTLLLVRQLK